MSNLGDYQSITTAAKKAGGVSALIKVIESKAVKEAAPRIFAKGLAAGGAFVLVVGTAGKKFLDKRKADQAEADAAKAALAAEVDALETEAGDDQTEPGSRDDADASLPPEDES